jgi:hypothetical protein
MTAELTCTIDMTSIIPSDTVFRRDTLVGSDTIPSVLAAVLVYSRTTSMSGEDGAIVDDEVSSI